MGEPASISEWVRAAEKRRQMIVAFIDQIEGSGYRDKHGHPIENNVAYKALRDAVG